MEFNMLDKFDKINNDIIRCIGKIPYLIVVVCTFLSVILLVIAIICTFTTEYPSCRSACRRACSQTQYESHSLEY